MQAVQNLGMAVVTMMAGRIVDDQGYLVLEVFFLAWLCRNNDLIIFISNQILIFLYFSIAGSHSSHLGDERQPGWPSQYVRSGKRQT